MGNSVNVEMPLLLLLLLVLPLSNPVSSEQSGLKENVKDDPEETMYKSEKLNGIEGKLSELMQRVKEMEVQFESSLEEMMLDTQKSELAIQIADLQNQLKEVKVERKNQNLVAAHNLKSEFETQFKAEVKKELDKVLPTAVEQGLRNLPFEMVCAYRELWETKGVVNYDNITVEFNNSDRPGGADGTMNIETGVFTTITSGYYIITFSGFVQVQAGEWTNMYLYHNEIRLEESHFGTSMHVGSGQDWIRDQGSRTVILHLLAGDTVDLRTPDNSDVVDKITLCLYMAPAPYGL